ncbi:MAG: hypothetical protein ACRDY0_10695 [Acidimicrobiales bacterium]
MPSNGGSYGPGLAISDVGYFYRSPPSGVRQGAVFFSVVQLSPSLSALRVDADAIWEPVKPRDEVVPPEDVVARLTRLAVPPQGAGGAGGAPPGPSTVLVTQPAVLAAMGQVIADAPISDRGPTDCPALTPTYEVAFATSATSPPDLVAEVAGCTVIGIARGGRGEPGLYDSGALGAIVGPYFSAP